MSGTQSIHALVRLLKSSVDPPTTPGPSKIEIARLSWSDPSFRAPNKGEVIGEWLLALLGQTKRTRRERDASSAFDPITDPLYWSLLSSILTTPPPATARPTKTWLLPLLNRLPLDTIVIELLALRPAQVLAPARATLTILWPLVEKKVSVDALAECLSVVFDTCTKWERMDDNLCWICLAVVSAYRSALVNAGNKKKLYSSFLTTHISSWLCAIQPNSSLVSPSPMKQLQDGIYTAGADTLFSLEALRLSLDTLFDTFSTSVSVVSLLLPVLPKIFATFLSAMQRHRSALFVSATGAVGGKEEVRGKGMEFVGRCWSLVRSSVSLQEQFDAKKWKSVIGLFDIVQEQRLYSAHSIRDIHKDMIYKGEVILSEARDTVVEVLEGVGASSEGHRAEMLALSTQLLNVFVQIEYDSIGFMLERVLSALINIPPPLQHVVSSSELLTHILEYHTKTRTVNTYALAIISSVVASSASSAYRMSSSPSVMGDFPLSHHLTALAQALFTALTPTQTAPLVTAVLRAVEDAWIAFKDANQEQERAAKKQKKVAKDADQNEYEARSVLAQARALYYVSRVAGTVLSNLPTNAYTVNEDYPLEHWWDDAGMLAWSIVWDCLKASTEEVGEQNRTKGMDNKKRKLVIKMGPLSIFSPHIIASAALRFLYEIRSRLSILLGDCDQLDETHVRSLLDVACCETSEPALVLEIIRTVLWNTSYRHNHDSQRQTKNHPIFTVTIDILTTHISSEARWSGASAALTHQNLGLAILLVLTDRWIGVFDALASTEDLSRLVSLLFDVVLDRPDENTPEKSDETYPQQNEVITLRGILLKLFRNAHFWELHNVRALFLSRALTLTMPLGHCFPAAAIDVAVTVIADTELTLACNAYGLLYFAPSEYFTRPARIDLVKRAMAADVQICAKLERANRERSSAKKDADKGDTEHLEEIYTDESDDGTEQLKIWTRRLTIIRIFLQRMGRLLNTPNLAASSTFVKHLLSPPLCISSPSKAITSVTLDLIQSHIASLLHSQESEAVPFFSSVVSTLIAARPFSHPNSQETWAHVVVQSSILNFIQQLTSRFNFVSLPDLTKHELKTLLEALESALSPHVHNLMESVAIGSDKFLSSERINAWSRILSWRRWLGINSASISLGLRLVTSAKCSATSAELDPEVCSSILELLLEELWCMPGITHPAQLDLLISFYAVNRFAPDSDRYTMDTVIAQASKKLTTEDFSHLLDVLVEGIGGGGLRADQREHLIHLGKIVLHGAPPGTLRVAQSFATRCLNLFTDRKDIYGGPSHLKMQFLEFIARHCSDRPAGIRSVDLGGIWSLLDKTLSGSSEHDDTTTFPIFHHIVTIVGALIRLRRDLVVYTLPHLSLILRQLMMLTRKIRPQLGGKQTKMVTDTFPSWLSASQHLSTDEARALARLLTSLTTKTIPRTHAYAHPPASTESQKAESLAKPFAKHAPYVLVAYVEAFNDPLCIINAEMRRDLEPGLFALCEMVGEHGRDALMVSTLDSGGKTVMKSLWREYEKQRYVGKG